MSAVLELDAVSKRFRSRHGVRTSEVVAVDDVSLAVAEREIVAVVGESGAGKSTLARLVLGLERPDTGTVRVDGVDLATLSRRRLRAARQRMHFVLQDPYQSLHPGMRVAQLVGEPLSIRGVAKAERQEATRDALERVALKPTDMYLSRYPHQLSGGQRQRVALARAIVARPRLIVADEPTSMLDASLCAEILELILRIRDAIGTALVYITHDLAVARWVSDRMVVMREGQVVEAGESDALVSNPSHDYTKLLLAASEGELEQIEPTTGRN